MDEDRREFLRATEGRDYITYPTKTARMEIGYYPASESLGNANGSPRMIEYREPEQTVFKRKMRYIREI